MALNKNPMATKTTLIIIFIISFQLCNGQKWSVETKIRTTDFRFYQHEISDRVSIKPSLSRSIISPSPFMFFGLSIKYSKPKYFGIASISTFGEYFEVSLSPNNGINMDYYRTYGLDYGFGFGKNLYTKKGKTVINFQILVHQLFSQPKPDSVIGFLPQWLQEDIQTFKSVQFHWALGLEGNAYKGLHYFINVGRSFGKVGEKEAYTFRQSFFITLGSVSYTHLTLPTKA